MKMMRTLLLMFLLPLLAWQISAQTPVKVFTGTSVPTEQGWTEQKLDATVNDLAAPTTQTVAGGVLNLTSTNATDQFSQLNWYRTDLEFDYTKGYVIEIKAKITSADKTGAFNIQGFDRTGKGFRIGILKNAVTEQTDPFAATNVLKSGMDNSGFHIYHIVATPNGTVEVLRDDESLGTFKLSSFQFDNIIENGGFEDEEFPDFLTTNGELIRVDDPFKTFSGNFSLEMFSAGFVTNDWSAVEGARTREIAIKPETEYEIYITRRRTIDPYCWRDMGAFYDFQKGTLGLKGDKVDARDDNVTWGGVNERFWQVHPQIFTTPEDAKTVRFEFPTWIRDNNFEVTSSFDNFTFREKPTLIVGAVSEPDHGFPEVVLPAGYINLIQNGDFEDIMMNNDGTEYEWELGSNGCETCNDPAKYNPMWNGDVRIQDVNKPDDFEPGNDFYAHSGTNALRFSTMNMDGQGKTRNFDFTVELEVGKTYCFNFWHRAPRWPDNGWLKVRIGDEVIWGNLLNGDFANNIKNNCWLNANLIFTATEENNTLHLYTDSDSHGDWWNVYLDDLVLYEVPVGTPLDPQIVGKTNLIANGDFEDVTIDNEGKPYTWAVASESSSDDDNYPVAWSDVWGAYVRIQDKQKIHDTGIPWAHSGNNSLRFSFLNDWNRAQEFCGLAGQGDYAIPDAFRTNMNFRKELEPNKTYTFVFWIKTANYADRGGLKVANGDVVLWDQELSTRLINWTRKSITFSTTEVNHTLRMFTEWTGWFNFYLDDLFLFEEDTYIPEYEDGTPYLAFGKSTGTSSTDVEIEYISIASTLGINTVNFSNSNNLLIYPNPVMNGELTVDNINSQKGNIEVYSILGALLKVYEIKGSSTVINVSSLPAGMYLVKADGKKAMMLKR